MLSERNQAQKPHQREFHSCEMSSVNNPPTQQVLAGHGGTLLPQFSGGRRIPSSKSTWAPWTDPVSRRKKKRKERGGRVCVWEL